MKEKKLDLTESSDFHYLLELMLPLYNEPQFAWLPELFSTIGTERLVKLCKYAGGERIKIPTISELSDAIEALEWYYKVWVTHEKAVTEVPVELHRLVGIIAGRFDNAGDRQDNDSRDREAI